MTVSIYLSAVFLLKEHEKVFVLNFSPKIPEVRIKSLLAKWTSLKISTVQSTVAVSDTSTRTTTLKLLRTKFSTFVRNPTIELITKTIKSLSTLRSTSTWTNKPSLTALLRSVFRFYIVEKSRLSLYRKLIETSMSSVSQKLLRTIKSPTFPCFVVRKSR